MERPEVRPVADEPASPSNQVGASGAVIGIDMTPEMLEKAKRLQDDAGFTQVEFRAGYLEEIPVEDGWADVVISNGVVDRGLEQTIADGAGGAEDGDV